MIGEETARWIQVGNCLHKTAVIAGLSCFGSSWMLPRSFHGPVSLVCGGVSIFCAALYGVSWQFDPCCQYQVEYDTRKLAKLPLGSLTSSSPIVLVRKDDKYRKRLHNLVAGSALIYCSWKAYNWYFGWYCMAFWFIWCSFGMFFSWPGTWYNGDQVNLSHQILVVLSFWDNRQLIYHLFWCRNGMHFLAFQPQLKRVEASYSLECLLIMLFTLGIVWTHLVLQADKNWCILDVVMLFTTKITKLSFTEMCNVTV